jgi:hypothetical protein
MQVLSALDILTQEQHATSHPHAHARRTFARREHSLALDNSRIELVQMCIIREHGARTQYRRVDAENQRYAIALAHLVYGNRFDLHHSSGPAYISAANTLNIRLTSAKFLA